MAQKLRNTSTVALHRRSKLHMEDALENIARPHSDEDVDDTSQQTFSTARDAAKSAGRGLSNQVSKARQRKALRQAQIAAAQQEKRAQDGIDRTGNIVNRATDAIHTLWRSTGAFVKKHPAAFAFVAFVAVFLVLFSSVMASCSAFVPGGAGSVLSTVYTAEDADILAVNADYSALERDLQVDLSDTPSSRTGYDEYRYELEDFGHNPYELASYLTVIYGPYTRDQVQHELPDLLSMQYEITYREETETRYREETRTRIVEEVDPETGETIEVVEEYTVRVPYTWKILITKMENHSMRRAVGFSGLTEDEMSLYAVLNQTYGGRPDLFEDDVNAVFRVAYPDYEVPPDALTDERFARMLQVAEQFLGYPYVWGGSNPSTSFDCSGYVSWIVNHSGNGWDFGRLTCTGLAAKCTIIRPEDARPGDLIFFQGTYDTAGYSHIGLYVGNGMMIHCGNPIQYADVTSSYWVNHFAAYGRLP